MNYPPDLKELQAQIQTLTELRYGNLDQLLELLRCLAQAYTDLREGACMDALPNTRHELYQRLNSLEQEGAWPLLSKVQIQTLLERLQDPPLHAELLDKLNG